MSTATTTALTTTPKKTRQRKAINHFFNRDAGEFARLNGLEVRAFCGTWVNFNGHRDAPVVLLATSGLRREDCKRCIASYNRLVRLKAAGG